MKCIYSELYIVVLGGKIEFYVKYLRVQYNHKLEKYASIMWLCLIITGEVFQLINTF